MNQRLVWNFEFSCAYPKKKLFLSEDVKDVIKWEIRYFWPSHKIITLNNLDVSLLELNNYEHKFQEDNYYILPDKDLTVKLRRKELLYKPVMAREGGAVGYGSKVLLKKSPVSRPEEKALLNELKKKGIKILVNKEAFVFKFPTHPSIKLELSRLKVGKEVFFSVCVEGRSLELVESISRQLIKKQKPSEYVKFLKESLKNDK